MTRWIALTTVLLLGMVTAIGLWVHDYREGEQAVVPVSAETRTETGSSAHAVSSWDAPARWEVDPRREALQRLGRSLPEAEQVEIRDTQPVLRPGTVLPALVLVAFALIAARWWEHRRDRS